MGHIVPLLGFYLRSVVECFGQTRHLLFFGVHFQSIFLPWLQSIAVVQFGAGIVPPSGDETLLRDIFLEMFVHFNKNKPEI
jgi:hypothetical protein